MSDRDIEFEFKLMSMSRMVPYHYERNTKTFTFGEEIRPIGEIEMYEPFHQDGYSLTQDDMRRAMGSVAFVSSFNRIYSFPAARDFIVKDWPVGLEEEASQAMHEAAIAMRKYRSDLDEFEDRLVEPNDFKVLTFPRGESSYVQLKAPGDCTCIGRDSTVEGDWQKIGVGTYTEHNVDNIVQKVSLMAGLGHIAKVANAYAAERAS